MSPNFSINGIAFWKNMIPLSVMTFPGGEPHIKLFEHIPENTNLKESNISVRLNCFEDIGKLLVFHNALIHAGGSINTIVIPYFPGARQDRIRAGEAFTAQMYAQIINRLEAKKVVILDPHSEVIVRLIKNITVISQADIWKNWVQQQIKKSALPIRVIRPDMGARQKTQRLAIEGQKIIPCSKKRDPQTGKLSNFTVHADSLQGIHGILVDDICDGGATFLGLAKELRKKGTKKLTLCITHGIFSKGFEMLFAHYDTIVTTKSIRKKYPQGVEILNILPI